MFLSLGSWLTGAHGGSNGMTSEAKKVVELLPDSFGTRADGTLPPCLVGSQAAHRETYMDRDQVLLQPS